MESKKNILIACTASVATIKLPQLIQSLQTPRMSKEFQFNIKVVTTENAKHFIKTGEIPNGVQVYDDKDEWDAWQERGDPVLHIDLGKWADILLISPLSANSLAKIASGICDNLPLCVVRAWNIEKPLFFCPAMNTRMYEHPITGEHIQKLRNWGYIEIPCISKTLMCGDTGNGAMAEVATIVEAIVIKCRNG